jgi:hypothetical protein
MGKRPGKKTAPARSLSERKLRPPPVRKDSDPDPLFDETGDSPAARSMEIAALAARAERPGRAKIPAADYMFNQERGPVRFVKTFNVQPGRGRDKPEALSKPCQTSKISNCYPTRNS